MFGRAIFDSRGILRAGVPESPGSSPSDAELRPDEERLWKEGGRLPVSPRLDLDYATKARLQLLCGEPSCSANELLGGPRRKLRLCKDPPQRVYALQDRLSAAL